MLRRLAPYLALACLAIPCRSALARDNPPTSPTAATAATVSPQAQDLAWQKASAKFAPARKAILAQVAGHVSDGPFRPDWASLKGYRSPAWYDDAKFGIFIHWGVYSVPAFGSEWYSRNMYQQGTKEFAHHVATYGPQSRFGYKDFVPMFKAEHFDADAWAALFREAGARYVVPVAEHHDGFAMYDSKLSDWTAVKKGPKRDVIGLLAKAIRGQGMHFGISSHRAEHDWFFDGGRHFDSDVNDPANAELYGPAVDHLSKHDEILADDWTYVSQSWLDDWLARTAEIIDDYHPDLIYFDWWIGHPTFRNTLPTLLSYYYNEGAKRDGVVVNYKLGDFPEGAGTLDIERGQLTGIHATHWQTDTSISNDSWGYVEHDTYKSPTFIIHLLADVVSKNGNLMLNIGPRADGTIPQGAQDTLRSIGAWLKVNGEAIYASKPWRVYGEGPTEVVGGTFQDTKTKPYTAEDFRFTTGNGKLYAIELGWPAKNKVTVHTVTPDEKVTRVELLADGSHVPFTQDTHGLHLTLPPHPVGSDAYVYRITLAAPLKVSP
ncbi:MAG TPA: alpha-L-fucosidase [Luteibacter sp.]|jgi:alpha-L-fucosidase|uniref:alpha-L-fucosidase n=1 Tax=Luteibacter sp. TaxID=1886636 RepID=UPI002F423D65